MVKIIILIFVVGVLGCASINQMPLEKDSLLGLGKEVVVVKRAMPDFKAVQSVMAAALFGPLGTLASSPSQYEAGNSLIKQNGISDPAYGISDVLARSMETKYQVRYKGVGSAVVNSDEVSSIANAYKDTPLALDVKTTYWAFAPLPFDFGKYRVVYQARLRLVDTKNTKVIAEGTCSSVPEKTDVAPTYEQLVADGASRIKSELEKASQYCALDFSSKYLGM